MAKKKWEIPKETLIRAVNETLKEFTGYCEDGWGEYEAGHCRILCGAYHGDHKKFSSVSTDWIRKEAISLRKTGQTERVNGGNKRRKLTKPQGRYAEYLSGEYWRCFRNEVLEFWGGKCALCARKASDVHHNDYSRRGKELLTDVVPLCKKCHKRFHGVMPDGNEEFNGDQDDTAEDGNGYGDEESLF